MTANTVPVPLRLLLRPIFRMEKRVLRWNPNPVRDLVHPGKLYERTILVRCPVDLLVTRSRGHHDALWLRDLHDARGIPGLHLGDPELLPATIDGEGTSSILEMPAIERRDDGVRTSHLCHRAVEALVPGFVLPGVAALA